ncbi:hypothetical protein NDU88_011409 [Pleurodeles waltl]|uniref:Uncharacterized protein n=1 Tax=Pleurodeles waltl TaxID=8319 RepID=A0AAV7QZX4_PLEWA|nr:hypothetical protein NDU88_011409 [Pleurodeles waltl]
MRLGTRGEGGDEAVTTSEVWGSEAVRGGTEHRRALKPRRRCSSSHMIRGGPCSGPAPTTNSQKKPRLSGTEKGLRRRNLFWNRKNSATKTGPP